MVVWKTAIDAVRTVAAPWLKAQAWGWRPPVQAPDGHEQAELSGEGEPGVDAATPQPEPVADLGAGQAGRMGAHRAQQRGDLGQGAGGPVPGGSRHVDNLTTFVPQKQNHVPARPGRDRPGTAGAQRDFFVESGIMPTLYSRITAV